MTLRDEILIPKAYSRRHIDQIMVRVRANPTEFDELVHLFLTDEYRVTNRVAAAMSHLVERDPHWILPHLSKILAHLDQPQEGDAVKRNTVRILRDLPDYPPELLGKIVDICFRFVENPNEAIAIRAFSAMVLEKIFVKNEEFRPLADELCDLMEVILPDASAGLKNTAQKILKRFGRR